MTRYDPGGRPSIAEEINFLLTNRLPRRWFTQLMGRISRVEQPLVRELCILVWRLIWRLDLRDAKKDRFTSVHDCFVRELKEGARPIDPDPETLMSPCDAIVGTCGRIAGHTLIQAKGFPYTLPDLLPDASLQALYRDGIYATLRITVAMYHRFHAPHDCRVEEVIYVSGDTWNVNPVALRKIEKLFCKNERAVVRTRLDAGGHVVTLVPIAAILVAGIRLHFLDTLFHVEHRGPSVVACDAPLRKGQEMGWFQHGSTIIVFAPASFRLCDGVEPGRSIRTGQALMRLPGA